MGHEFAARSAHPLRLSVNSDILIRELWAKTGREQFQQKIRGCTSLDHLVGAGK
jgi:hypothetical protein